MGEQTSDTAPCRGQKGGKKSKNGGKSDDWRDVCWSLRGWWFGGQLLLLPISTEREKHEKYGEISLVSVSLLLHIAAILTP